MWLSVLICVQGSLLWLQTLLYFDYWFSVVLFALQFVFMFFKLFALPYPSGYWRLEILILVAFLFI